MHLYNEIDPFAAQWLRNLSDADLIVPGAVDTRSIAELEPSDLEGVTQFHTFAGIGVWSYALRLAGWPDDFPAWTGSAPCQPFSAIGQREGYEDSRHLAPKWLELIAECSPPVVFGEQVASPSGRQWLADLRAQMEAMGYAVAAADLCAASVGSPHIRQRLFFGAVRLADSRVPRLERHSRHERYRHKSGRIEASSPRSASETRRACVLESNRAGIATLRKSFDRAPSGPWDSDWILCRDPDLPRWRPVEPGTLPLANGPSERVELLRAYGNAIVPQVAATFVEAFVDSV